MIPSKHQPDVDRILQAMRAAFIKDNAHEVERWGKPLSATFGYSLYEINSLPPLVEIPTRRMKVVLPLMLEEGLIVQVSEATGTGSRRVGVAGGGAGNFHPRSVLQEYKEVKYRAVEPAFKEPSNMPPAPAPSKPAKSAKGGGISDLVFFLEVVWSEIQGRHKDLPPAVIVVASGEEKQQSPVWGHWGDSRWKSKTDGTMFGEVLIAGEALEDGPERVLNTLLHEGAHALAAARKIKDTSRGARYHNERYKRLAEEMGLSCEKGPHGWNQTSLTDRSRKDYADVLQAMATKIHTVRPSAKYRPPTPEGEEGEGEGGAEGEGTSKKKGGRVSLSCGCTPARKIWSARATIAQGDILCGMCGLLFTPDEPVEAPAQPDEEPEEDEDDLPVPRAEVMEQKGADYLFRVVLPNGEKASRRSPHRYQAVVILQGRGKPWWVERYSKTKEAALSHLTTSKGHGYDGQMLHIDYSKV